jgi:hypothetical protein
MAKDEYGHMTVGELKAFVKKYKKVHCKSFSKLDRAGLISLVKEIEAHERKVEVIPKMSADEIEKALQAKKEMRKPREKKVEPVSQNALATPVSQNALAGSATRVKEKKKRVVSDANKAALKNVQALKKARGVSLKEAWELHKAGEKAKKKFVLKKKEEQKN